MPSFRTATVTEITAERPGLQRVLLGDDRAYVLTQLTGPVAVGDEVVVNTTAVELGLGTGGWHVVHWNLARESWTEVGRGHIMKLRYTSLQIDSGAAEEQHPGMPARIPGVPVVACSLHSQLPGVAVAVHAAAPDARIAYVMTDGAALPIVLSDLVAAMTEVGLLAGTITAGHAFGGDLEAVTVASALVLARHVLAADVIIVAMGPGVVGTGTRLGTTALEVASVLDAAAWLGADPILCPRVSDADVRPRHQGISHHSLTALDAVRSPVTVAVPLAGTEPTPDELGGAILVRVAVPDVAALLASAGLQVTTMGREPHQEPEFFAACGATGALAASRIVA